MEGADSAEAPARAVAIVSVAEDGTVKIQVGLRDPARWRTRLLRFAKEDDPLEIWTAVGFAAGTLATTMERGEEEEPPAPPEAAAAAPSAGPAKAAPPAAASAPAPKRPPVLEAPGSPPPEPDPASFLPRMTVDLAAMAGTGIERGAARIGPRGMVTAWVGRFWSLGLRGDVAWVATPPRNMSYRVAGIGVGPGASWILGDVRLTLRTVFGVDQIQGKRVDSTSTQRDGRWIGSVGLGGEGEWPCNSPVRAMLGVDAVWPFGTTDVVVREGYRPEPSRVHAGAAFGIRVGAACQSH